MKRSHFKTLILVSLVSVLLLSGCTDAENGQLTASGTLSARTVSIAPELSGKVLEVLVEEGDLVQAGDVLVRMDDEFPQAQLEQGQAAVQAAEATLEAAQAQLKTVQTQRDLAIQAARGQNMQSRMGAWAEKPADDYRPAWYFQKPERIHAAEAAVAEALNDLELKQYALERVLDDASHKDFITTEERLAKAEAVWTASRAALAQAKTNNDEALVVAAEKVSDGAEADYDAALRAYDNALTTSAAEEVLEARAEVAVAQANYDYTRDMLTGLQNEEQSMQVQAAEDGVAAAESAVKQAEANLEQARAAVKVLELQVKRAEILSPIDGVVMARNVEPGELIAAGGVVLSVGRQETLELVVYLPENRYGTVNSGDKVNIKVDSYPNESFNGTVSAIADQMEFTPRNVQTVDGRTSSVYAITIQVPNPSGKLKPGMPADVIF